MASLQTREIALDILEQKKNELTKEIFPNISLQKRSKICEIQH